MPKPSPTPGVPGFPTLTPNGSKARFGVAYVRAVFSQAGVGFAETSIDEDVLAVDGRVEFAAIDVRVQIKCTGKFKIKSAGTATWPADPVWWRKWHMSKAPAYFILVVLDPDVQPEWLDHRSDGTLNRAAAFWTRVDQSPASDGITVAKAQRLTTETAHEWAAEIHACYGGS